MIPEVPKTWISIYLVAQRKFKKEVFSTKAVPFGISYRHAWRNLYRWFISNVITDFYVVEDIFSFWCLCLHVLYFIWNLVILSTYYVRISTSHVYFYPTLVFISSFIWGSFIMIYIYVCIYVLFLYEMYYSVTRRNSLTEWSTLYKYIFKIRK